LEIPVHRDDHIASRRLDPGAHRRRLSEVEAEPDHAQLAPLGSQARQLGERSVARAVVDADHLVAPPELRELAEELVEQRLDALRFVE